MLKSLFVNNPGERFSIYLIHSDLDADCLEDLKNFIAKDGSCLNPILIDDGLFADAPVIWHYTKAMYYRLLASKFLPLGLDRILYLDPDILVLNPVRPLYDLSLDGYLFAAAFHDVISVKEINRIRLNPYPIDAYYNSGVLLMNLELQRQRINEQEIFDFVEKNRMKLLMPDQDALNALYAKEIKSVDTRVYNYDARCYKYYKLVSEGLCDLDHVMATTVFLHFCGKKKPWKKNYKGKFASLYAYFMRLALG